MATVAHFAGLYGDHLENAPPAPFHCESVRDRSSQYDWTIPPHRHNNLAQIFLFLTPDITLHVGDLSHDCVEPALLVVPPKVPHGFRFGDGVIGEVLSLRMSALSSDMRARIESFAATDGLLLPRSKAQRFDEIAALIAQCANVYKNLPLDRSAILEAQINLLVLYLLDETERNTLVAALPARIAPTQHEVQVERFCELIETRFAEDWAVADYARAVGVSAPHLTRICKAVLGHPPNTLVRQRRMLEAKKLLEFTRLPISVIALRSGFRDPAFFSRAFKANVGVPPQSYRQAT